MLTRKQKPYNIPHVDSNSKKKITDKIEHLQMGIYTPMNSTHIFNIYTHMNNTCTCTTHTTHTHTAHTLKTEEKN